MVAAAYDDGTHVIILHPARLAGTRWLRGLEAMGCAPSPVRVYLAGARPLCRAAWRGRHDRRSLQGPASGARSRATLGEAPAVQRGGGDGAPGARPGAGPRRRPARGAGRPARLGDGGPAVGRRGSRTPTLGRAERQGRQEAHRAPLHVARLRTGTVGARARRGDRRRAPQGIYKVHVAHATRGRDGEGSGGR